MWERDRLVSENILICRRPFVGLSPSLFSFSRQTTDVMKTPTATGEHLRRFPLSARILVAAKPETTFSHHCGRHLPSSHPRRCCTERPLATAAAQLLQSRRSRPVERPSCTSLSAFAVFISAVVLPPVHMTDVPLCSTVQGPRTLPDIENHQRIQ